MGSPFESELLDGTPVTVSPCPFCGSDDIKATAHPRKDKGGEWTLFYIACRNPECGASLSDETEAILYAKWNRRDGI